MVALSIFIGKYLVPFRSSVRLYKVLYGIVIDTDRNCAFEEMVRIDVVLHTDKNSK